ncbi:MAG: 50S ribosomal protein L11 methyltransferase [Smithellaceae bacterium]|nr:50S ribosomal protein L11 methyltransferase [Syntrophaceae bacterium]MBP8608208.1 50S ribosomal protein L11 methyltransferase [Syntrophaceae bacterium]NMD04669.1 50S ribosomal protein L11 methyltransferase [Deltaproteobacteria bacterium]
MVKKQPEKWLKMEIEANAQVMDALGNFLTETGAQGIFQEALEPQLPGDFPEQSDTEKIHAYFPDDARVGKRISTVQNYMDSLSQIFPEFKKPSLKTEVISDPDWGEQWKKYFKPIRVSGNIIVKPTWERYSPSSRDIIIEIDPGMAFGTGQHASTRMCLQAVEDIILKDRSIKNWKVLDVGCGTGILGITAAKLGAQDVIGVDIDKKAVEIARENAAINEVDDCIKFINRDVKTLNESRNLIIANLTAKLLLELGEHLKNLLVPNGYMVISGIVEPDRQAIEENFCIAPFIQDAVITEKEWVCYALKKSGRDI